MEDVLLGHSSAAVVDCLPLSCSSSLRTVARASCAEISPHIIAVCGRLLDEAVPDKAAQEHLRILLDVSDVRAVLHRRRWLLDMDAATTYKQWKTERPSTAQMTNGVSLDGGDLFAALKRTLFASKVPALSETPAVVHWMHVLGAIEEQDIGLAAEAWAELAPTLSKDNLVWVVQSAHFMDAIDNVGGWLSEGWLSTAGGPSNEEVAEWLQALESRLKMSPGQGRYGPESNSSQLRARSVAKLIRILGTTR